MFLRNKNPIIKYMLVRPTIYHPLEGVIMVHHFTE